MPRPAYADAFEASFPPPARRVDYVRADRKLIEGKQSPFWQRPGEGRFSIPLPDGGAIAVVVDRSEMLDAGRFTSEGHIEGQPASRVIVSYGPCGQLAASIQVDTPPEVVQAGGKTLLNFAIRPTGTEEAQIYEVDDASIPPDAPALRPKMDGDVLAAVAKRRATSQASDVAGGGTEDSSSPIAADTTPRATMDLMLLYTQAVVDAMPGTTETARAAAIQTQFDNTVAGVNSSFSRSSIAARVRLVKVAKVSLPGDESSTSLGDWNVTALEALRKTSDGVMDEIHAMRDEAGADFVCLAVKRYDPLSSGVGYMLQYSTLTDTREAFLNDFYAFSVVNFNYFGSNNVVAHEFGHNLGCQHDRENADGEAGAYSYSYGYRFYGKNGLQYRTIMAYSPGTRLDYFSNPNIVASESGVGMAVGVTPGLSGEADNALTIERNAFEVAAYRLKADSSTGTLLCVSTRAFVGTGEQQLIGGIAITGTQPKRLLVRAVGAALAQYGVPGVLTNPKIALVPVGSTGAVLSNDDWTVQSDSAAVAAASTAVGAFSLAGYPRDAAMLATLAPGSYTAVVDGVGGETGIALVEAYEVDRPAGTRLFGLSTRGYADKGKELIAGVAIEGESGQTKRIIIRVQGPNLAQYGIGNAMFDPYMELYAADGTMLLANDDWSSGTSVVGNDFYPYTDHTYSEKEISKTPFAPKNRREPAVLVDLLPGLYTVVVKPFEKISSNPDENQTAEPGVALVEVYEINP